MHQFNYSNYLSPFTWRYGSSEMRQIFSEQYKYQLWRQIWVAIAQAQQQAGLVSQKELQDLIRNQNKIDIDRILEIEKETKHDLVAAIKEYAQKAKIGGGKIHLGCTSMDITDNADVLRIKVSLQLIKQKLILALKSFSQKIKTHADLPCLGYTHLQPAEPTTLGYRLAFYAQDFLLDFNQLNFLEKNLKAKGIKGAVGTSASFRQLLKGKKITPDKFEELVMDNLGLKAYPITSQVYPRKQDYLIVSLLASIAQSASKFAFDLRIMQSAGFAEWSEPFAQKQVGSSAMPFKKNPIKSENICSLARFISTLPQIAWENASQSLLERTLDDSANRRLITPQAFLSLDEILKNTNQLIDGLIINKKQIAFNLNQHASFAAIEPILMEAVKNGANRQQMHELLRNLSLQAQTAIQQHQPNPLRNLLLTNRQLLKYVTKNKLIKLLGLSAYTGNAPAQAQAFSHTIKKAIRR